MSQNPFENSQKKNPVEHTFSKSWKEAFMSSPGPKTFLEHSNLFLKGL